MGDGVSYLDLIPFRYLYKKCTAWWLQTGEGGGVNDSLGQLCDQFAQRAYLGLVARFPDYAVLHSLGTLGLIGRDRKIVRGINEPDAAYATRLKRFLTDHRLRGNPFALHDQLRAYCQVGVKIRTVDRSGNWFSTDYDGTRSVFRGATDDWEWDNQPGSNWSRFWVIIYPVGGTDPWATQLWGQGTTFGTTATVDQVSSVRSIIADWKPAGTTCDEIIIAFDDASLVPGITLGNNYIPWHLGNVSSRLQSARYWFGPRDDWAP